MIVRLAASIIFSPAPSGAPGGLTTSSVESRLFIVQWETVLCPNQRGPIVGYRLRYSNGTFIVNTTGEGSRQHVLTGLTPFTSYSVQVAAVNALIISVVDHYTVHYINICGNGQSQTFQQVPPLVMSNCPSSCVHLVLQH